MKDSIAFRLNGKPIRLDIAGPIYSFEIASTESGCVLRLWKRETSRSSSPNKIWFLAKRPLPDCACNP